MYKERGIQKYKRGAVLVLLLVLSSLSMALSDSVLVQAPEKFTLTVFTSMQSGVNRVSGWISGTVNSISELRQLRDQYETAMNKIQSYEGIERNYIDLLNENQRLRRQLDFSQRLDRRHTPAQIIARDPENLFNTLAINKGYSDGIKEGMPVIAFQKDLYGLVGKTVKVSAHSSLVKPVFDRSSYIAARLRDSRYQGLISGRGGTQSTVRMEYVKKPARSEINHGDLVVTSGLGSIYPAEISIGRVRKIYSQEYATSLEIIVEPVIDFTRLEYVFVLKETS